jgi:hypothetical protein
MFGISPTSPAILLRAPPRSNTRSPDSTHKNRESDSSVQTHKDVT